LATNPAKARDELEVRIARAIEKHKPEIQNPAGGDARCDHAVPHPALIESAAAVCGGEPVLVSPVPPPPPPPPATAAERQANVDRLNSQPANPAPGPPEEWRKFVGPDGEIRSPWFVPHG
jgi:hypothetical protein